MNIYAAPHNQLAPGGIQDDHFWSAVTHGSTFIQASYHAPHGRASQRPAPPLPRPHATARPHTLSLPRHPGQYLRCPPPRLPGRASRPPGGPRPPPSPHLLPPPCTGPPAGHATRPTCQHPNSISAASTVSSHDPQQLDGTTLALPAATFYEPDFSRLPGQHPGPRRYRDQRRIYPGWTVGRHRPPPIPGWHQIFHRLVSRSGAPPRPLWTSRSCSCHQDTPGCGAQLLHPLGPAPTWPFTPPTQSGPHAPCPDRIGPGALMDPIPPCIQPVLSHWATPLSSRATRPSRPACSFASGRLPLSARPLLAAKLAPPRHRLTDLTAPPRRHGAAFATLRSKSAVMSTPHPLRTGPTRPALTGSDPVLSWTRSFLHPGRSAAPSHAAILPGHGTEPARLLLRFGSASTLCQTALGTPPAPVDGSHRLSMPTRRGLRHTALQQRRDVHVPIRTDPTRPALTGSDPVLLRIPFFLHPVRSVAPGPAAIFPGHAPEPAPLAPSLRVGCHLLTCL